MKSARKVHGRSPRVASVNFDRKRARERSFCRSPEARFLTTNRFNYSANGKRSEFSGSGRKNTATEPKIYFWTVGAARHFPFFSFLLLSISPPPPPSPFFPPSRSRVLLILISSLVVLIVSQLFWHILPLVRGRCIPSPGRFINFPVIPSENHETQEIAERDIVRFSLKIRTSSKRFSLKAILNSNVLSAC